MALLPRKFRTQHIRRRYHRLLYRRAAVIGGGLFFLVLLLVGVMYLPFLQIRDVKVAGAPEEDSSLVVRTVEAVLDGSYAFVIPKKFIFFYPRSAITASVGEAFPAFSSVKPSLSLFSGLSVQVTQRKPMSLWCGDVVPDSQAAYTPGACYYMDETGFIYEQAPVPPPSIFVWFYGAIHQSKPIGATFLSADTLVRFTKLEQALKTAGVPVRAILVIDDQDAELYLERGEKVIIAYADDPGDVSDRLVSVLDAAPLQKIDPRQLDYIDLRFGDKVYYKLKGN